MQLSERQRLAARETAVLRETALKLLALEADRRKVFNLAEVGQRVYLAADVAKAYGVSAGPYEITSTRGIGDDQFVALKGLRNLSGEPRFVRSTQLTAALATHGQSPLDGTPTKEIQMRNETANAELLELASQIQRERNIPWREAARLAGKKRRDLAEDSRPVEPSATAVKTPEPAAALHLSSALEAKCEDGSTPFYQLCAEYAAENRCDLRDAVHVLGQRFPELATAR